MIAWSFSGSAGPLTLLGDGCVSRFRRRRSHQRSRGLRAEFVNESVHAGERFHLAVAGGLSFLTMLLGTPSALQLVELPSQLLRRTAASSFLSRLHDAYDTAHVTMVTRGTTTKSETTAESGMKIR